MLQNMDKYTFVLLYWSICSAVCRHTANTWTIYQLVFPEDQCSMMVENHAAVVAELEGRVDFLTSQSTDSDTISDTTPSSLALP